MAWHGLTTKHLARAVRLGLVGHEAVGVLQPPQVLVAPQVHRVDTVATLGPKMAVLATQSFGKNSMAKTSFLFFLSKNSRIVLC